MCVTDLTEKFSLSLFEHQVKMAEKYERGDGEVRFKIFSSQLAV